MLYLKWGYDYLNDIQKEFFHLTEKWETLEQQDRKFLTGKMLGLDAIKSPEVLYKDLFDNHFIIDGRFGSPIQSEYDNAYLYLKEKIEKSYNSKCSQVCLDLYNKL